MSPHINLGVVKTINPQKSYKYLCVDTFLDVIFLRIQLDFSILMKNCIAIYLSKDLPLLLLRQGSHTGTWR